MEVRYEERHWVPAWIVAAAFLAPVAVLLGGTLIARAAGAGDVLSPAVGTAYGAVLGLLLASLVWRNHSRRVIRVDDRSLRIGSREPIPLGEIQTTRAVSGQELRRLRGSLTSLEGAELGAPASIASPSLAEVAVGGAMLAGRSRRAGMVSPPWMRSAALVVTRTAATRAWLVGSRDADGLVAAIEAARRSGADDRPGE